MGKEVNNKIVVLLALLLVLVVTASTWLVLHKMDSIGIQEQVKQPVTEQTEPIPNQVGRVSLTILPPGGTGENEAQ